MKVMLSGADSMFSVWLTFFREQLATYVALLVLLPLTLLLNWQLSLVLIVLVVVFCAVTIAGHPPDRGRAGSGRSSFQSSLAGTVQDALANVIVVQSFTRLAAETRRFGQIADDVIAHQFPVLNWWAVDQRAHPRRVHDSRDRHRVDRHASCTSTGQASRSPRS